MKPRLIFKTDDSVYRILEYLDETATLDDLKGDCYNPKYVTDIEPELLRRDELKFERRVENEGAFGYVLEKWNAKPGIGYESLDSCWSFVGQYVPDAEGYDHYIISEMKQTIQDDVSRLT